MLKHLVAIAVRQMRRHTGYTAINVLGLAVGMACTLLIFLYIRYESSYDRHHLQADRIYRVVVNEDARSPRSLVLAMQEALPEIEQYARLLPTFGTWIMRYEDRIYYEKSVYWADNSLFDVFTMPLVRGDPQRALEAPYTVVISEDIAAKYFGNEDPIGRTMVADNGFLLLTITGVMENIPDNAHFHADFLISLATGYDKFEWKREYDDWRALMFYTYVVLPKGHSPTETEGKLPAFLERSAGDRFGDPGRRFDIALQPVTDIHLHSQRENESGANSEIVYLYILAAIGLFILIIALANYVNLSTAQFAHRMHEIGMRRILGASRPQLIRQVLSESICTAMIAVVIAAAAIRLASPYVDGLMGMPVTESFAMGPAWWLVLLLFAMLIGVCAGAYPAVLCSSERTIAGLRAGPGFQPGGAWFRKMLVVCQFTISIVLIIGAGVLFAQLDFIKNKKLGFEKDLVIVIPTVQEVALNYSPWKDALLQYPGVEGVSQALTIPGLFGTIGRSTAGSMRRVDAPEDVMHGVEGYRAADGFVETMGMELLAGRTHRGPYRNESDWENIVINESAVRVLGWPTPDEAIGRQIRFASGQEQTVIGVVRDYHYRTLRQEIKPLVLFGGTGLHLVVRIQAGDTRRTLAFIERTWSAFFPDYPFAYTFLEEDIGRLYRNEMRIGTFVGAFAAVAALLTCLGLFALISFTAQRRMRELGIRKALGASVRRLLGTLCAEFVALALVANVFAWPAAWLIIRLWLDNFAYRVEIGWAIFLASGGIALLITLMTIGYHAIRAAFANPAEVLRNA